MEKGRGWGKYTPLRQHHGIKEPVINRCKLNYISRFYSKLPVPSFNGTINLSGTNKTSNLKLFPPSQLMYYLQFRYTNTVEPLYSGYDLSLNSGDYYQE